MVAPERPTDHQAQAASLSNVAVCVRQRPATSSSQTLSRKPRAKNFIPGLLPAEVDEVVELGMASGVCTSRTLHAPMVVAS